MSNNFDTRQNLILTLRREESKALVGSSQHGSKYVNDS